MTKSTSLVAVALGCAALAGCFKSNDPEPAQIEEQLRAREAEWNHAYANHDAKALAAMYADDAALANPGSELVRGKDAITKETAMFAADPNLKVEFAADRIYVAKSGDVAYTRGHYTLTMTDPATNKAQSSTGSYLTVWREQPDKSWKAVEDFVTPGPEPASD